MRASKRQEVGPVSSARHEQSVALPLSPQGPTPFAATSRFSFHTLSTLRRRLCVVRSHTFAAISDRRSAQSLVPAKLSPVFVEYSRSHSLAPSHGILIVDLTSSAFRCILLPFARTLT